MFRLPRHLEVVASAPCWNQVGLQAMTTNLPCPSCKTGEHQNCDSPICICMQCWGEDDPREALRDLVWMMRRRVA